MTDAQTLELIGKPTAAAAIEQFVLDIGAFHPVILTQGQAITYAPANYAPAIDAPANYALANYAVANYAPANDALALECASRLSSGLGVHDAMFDGQPGQIHVVAECQLVEYPIAIAVYGFGRQ